MLTRFTDAATALAQQARELSEANAREMASIKEENERLQSEIEQVRKQQAAAVQAAVTRIGRNPDMSRAMEEAFQAGRSAGLAEAADMAETYVFECIDGEPIKLGFDRGMAIVVQHLLAEHMRARAEGQEEPVHVPFDPRSPRGRR